ncbi:hypothetical protein G3T14_15610 [Methylobacterium sp. BTF04]|uniref:hypothetical protein n=1 Tax=Methylobacterium sp. BTF04 TaxID=2708300 RepID=UPI0013D8428C|nr:hypothetical protein [Methylobacterium sp. BTF04]NEU13548.1 hypothetical protein [Methylobacterium sp. BTF04]
MLIGEGPGLPDPVIEHSIFALGVSDIGTILIDPGDRDLGAWSLDRICEDHS